MTVVLSTSKPLSYISVPLLELFSLTHISIGLPFEYEEIHHSADLQLTEEPMAWVITSSGIAAVKFPSANPAKVSPHVPLLSVPERQSQPNGTHLDAVPSTVLSGTITRK